MSLYLCHTVLSLFTISIVLNAAGITKTREGWIISHLCATDYLIRIRRYRKNHMNPLGGLHGGAYASAVDTAAYWAAYFDLPEKDGLVSLDIKVDFIAPVIDGKILVKGKSIKAGKTIHLTEAGIFAAGGKLLAHGTSKLLVTHNRQSINDAAEYMGSRKLPEKFIEG